MANTRKIISGKFQPFVVNSGVIAQPLELLISNIKLKTDRKELVSDFLQLTELYSMGLSYSQMKDMFYVSEKEIHDNVKIDYDRGIYILYGVELPLFRNVADFISDLRRVKVKYFWEDNIVNNEFPFLQQFR